MDKITRKCKKSDYVRRRRREYVIIYVLNFFALKIVNCVPCNFKRAIDDIAVTLMPHNYGKSPKLHAFQTMELFIKGNASMTGYFQ